MEKPPYMTPSSGILSGLDDSRAGDVIHSWQLFRNIDYQTPSEEQIQLGKKVILPPERPMKVRGLKLDEGGSTGISEDDQVGEDQYSPKKKGVSKLAVALHTKSMLPPCVRNLFTTSSCAAESNIYQKKKSILAGPSVSIGGPLKRYTNDFVELASVGEGDFGEVVKAQHRLDGIPYAIKKSILPYHADTEREKVLQEAHALAALGSHDNIVRYHTCFFEEGYLYIQMELCDGNLSVLEADYTPLGAKLFDVSIQIAEALDFLKKNQICHRDIKPANIFVKNGCYKLGDFGLAVPMGGSSKGAKGDGRYLPPELLNTKASCPDKIDIYSLGVSLYELLRGSPLSTSERELLKEGILVFPADCCSEQFQTMLKAMISKDPVKRPSAREVAECSTREKELSYKALALRKVEFDDATLSQNCLQKDDCLKSNDNNSLVEDDSEDTKVKLLTKILAEIKENDVMLARLKNRAELLHEQRLALEQKPNLTKGKGSKKSTTKDNGSKRPPKSDPVKAFVEAARLKRKQALSEVPVEIFVQEVPDAICAQEVPDAICVQKAPLLSEEKVCVRNVPEVPDHKCNV